MKIFTIFMIVVDILVASCFVLVYGIPSFKNKIISTAMVTKTHKYIAYIFYDEETIDKVTAQNRYIPLTDKVNLDEIVINTSERDSYDNKYDEEINNDNHPLYKHRFMVKDLLDIKKYCNRDEASEQIKEYTSIVCKNILVNTAVFKQDEVGQKGFKVFLSSLGLKKAN